MKSRACTFNQSYRLRNTFLKGAIHSIIFLHQLSLLIVAQKQTGGREGWQHVSSQTIFFIKMEKGKLEVNEEVVLKVLYDYYGQKKTMPLFVNVGVLNSLDYNDFVCLTKESVPHVLKLSKLRVTYKDDDKDDVDLL